MTAFDLDGTYSSEVRKASVRVRVKHPHHVIESLSGCRKVSYRGIAKNETRANVRAALANFYMAKRRSATQWIGASATL